MLPVGVEIHVTGPAKQFNQRIVFFFKGEPARIPQFAHHRHFAVEHLHVQDRVHDPFFVGLRQQVAGLQHRQAFELQQAQLRHGHLAVAVHHHPFAVDLVGAIDAVERANAQVVVVPDADRQLVVFPNAVRSVGSGGKKSRLGGPTTSGLKQVLWAATSQPQHQKQPNGQQA